MNTRGDKGQPCLTDLANLKDFVGLPFKIMLDEAQEKLAFRKLERILFIPTFSIVAKM